MEWYLGVLKKYVEFSGRARRKEYWMFFLFNFIISAVLGFVEGLFGGPGFIGILYSLVIFLPSLAVTVRRMHDIGRSGWWILILFVPLIGLLVFLYFMIQEGKDDTNAFGDSPKLVAA
ncbi:DUF805 domain-containing protein [Oceanobacter mangrovi]|uniref:DUF805 domain-containing protein n=1 Tax=Oceanobacter mangrovi TaxID=2862510 RepID=UPI001C8DFD36|nr:DUF805 domain-containing protein [Oceanobacter mangrovi]